MKSQKTWGAILTILGLTGGIYCFMDFFSYGVLNNPMSWPALVAIFAILGGLSMLCNHLENQPDKK